MLSSTHTIPAPAENLEVLLRANRNRFLTILLCLLMLAGAAYAKTPPKSKHHSAKSAKAHKTAKKRGQQAMDSARVREIQSALIRERYLDGQANGIWDDRSKQAMQKFQGDNGWQTKMTPDSRALIKLGLGPDHANLINPETAATSLIPGGGSSNSAQR